MTGASREVGQSQAADYGETGREIARLQQRLAELEAAEAERVRAEAVQRRYAHRLKVLNRIERSILEVQDPEAIAGVVLEHLLQLVPFSCASVLEFDLKAGRARVLASHLQGRTSPGTGDQIDLAPALGIVDELKTGQARVADNGGATLPPDWVSRDLAQAKIGSSIQIPLIVGEELIGSLNLGAFEPEAFSAECLQVAREVADPMALALHNSRLYRAEQRERQQAETLYHVVELLNASLDADEVLQALLQASARSLQADDCSILLLDPLRGDLVFRASTDIPRERLAQGIRVPPDESIAGRAIRERAPQIVPDVKGDPDYYPQIAQSIGTRLRSLLAVPLKRGDEVPGVVEALFGEAHDFKDDEVNLLVAIANSAATALENAQLYESTQKMLQRRTAELDTIRQVAAAVNRTMSIETILTQGLDEMLKVSPADAGAIYLLESEPDGEAFVLKACRNMLPEFASDYAEIPFKDFQAFVAAEADRRPQAGGDMLPNLVRVGQKNTQFLTTGYRSGLILTLNARDQLLGLIGLAARAANAFSASDEELFCCIADQIAVAAENAHLLEQARQDAQTKATLLREVSHRVKNNLAAILGIVALEMNRPVDETMNFHVVMQDIQSRIRGLATIHDLLSATHWSPLPLDELVKDVIHAALGGSPIQQRIGVTVRAPKEKILVAPKQATGLALVVNELTTNSIKHGFRGRPEGDIDVEISTGDLTGQVVTLRFRDDGPGWPQDVLRGERESVGLRLVRLTVRSPLRGFLALDNDGGAVTTVTFRLAPSD
jgi:GAF domain-containing protein